jgi:iron complex outermembrane receptor protein
MKNVKRMAPALAVGAFVWTGGSVSAGVLEEVVVTAQKREQSSQDVGISITAMSGEAMDSLGLDNTQEISQQVPGLQLQTFTPAFTVFNLRGISQNNFADNLEAPVAVYMDDAYVASMNALGQQMFDMRRVEVLRGPQGTLFGRNATGGLIHYVTNKADEDVLNGYVESSVSSFDTYSVEGALGGALADGVRGRVAARWETSDGYVEPGSFAGHQAQGRASHGADGYSIRGNLQFDVRRDGQLDLTAYYSEDSDVPSGQYVVTFTGFDPETGLGAYTNAIDPATGLETNFPQTPITGDVHEHASDQDTYFDRETKSLTAKYVDFLPNGVELTSVTNWSQMDKYYLEDAGGGLVYFPFITAADFEQVSQEIRFAGEGDRFRWQAGVYYLDMSVDGLFSVEGEAITGFPGGLVESHYALDASNASVFGQLEYDVADHWTLIAGYRWSEDDKDLEFRTLAYNLGLPDGTALFDLDQAMAADASLRGLDTIDYGDYAARLQLNWEPAESTLVFASYNRGIKGGNWSVNQDVALDNFKHKEEVLHSYEMGLKTSMMDGLVRFNATGFYYDYEDYQAFSLTNVVPQVANSDAKVKGGELEMFLVSGGWDVVLGASFIDSEVDFVNAAFPGTGTYDAELPNAPELSLNALVRYSWAALGGDMAVQMDGVWNDDQYLEGTNSEVSLQESYATVNARASYMAASGAWEVAAWVKNATDEEYLLYNLDLGLLGFVEQVYGRPRTYGMTASYHW